MMKKGMELSLNTIIIAAVALIVLIVIVVIFTGQTGKFVGGLRDCKSRGGEEGNCRDTESVCIGDGGVPAGECVFKRDDGSIDKSQQNRVCCVFRK